MVANFICFKAERSIEIAARAAKSTFNKNIRPNKQITLFIENISFDKYLPISTWDPKTNNTKMFTLSLFIIRSNWFSITKVAMKREN
jgi:hypothetical protein